MPAVHAVTATTALTDHDEIVLSELRTLVCSMVATFDACVLDREGAVFALEQWSSICHAADAALAMTTARISQLGPPPSAGARNAADYVAKKTGTTCAKAQEKIGTGHGLHDNDDTRARAVSGALSTEQAAAITDALAVNPDAEEKLLDVAARGSLGELRDACAKAKVEREDLAATEKRIHASRCLRRYTDKQGAEHLHAVGTKASMARLDQALKPFIDERFKAARTDGEREPLVAYAYDALIALADCSRETSPSDGPSRRAASINNLAILRLDLEPLVRGDTEPGETCEIVGLGPISVVTARGMLGESILKLVITKGVDVQNVTHLGRGPNIAQKIALLWQSPVCMREGCNNTRRLEHNHAYGAEYRTTKHTRLDETEPLCDPDHDLQTLHDWSLIAGKGKRPMVPPDDPRHPKNHNRPPP